MDLRLAPDERELARQGFVGRTRRLGWRHNRGLRTLHAGRCRQQPLPEDLLIELLGRRLGLDAELSLKNAETDLVLPKGRRPPAELNVKTHDRAMDGLLQGVEREEPERRLRRRLRRLRGALMTEKLRQRFERQLTQSLALREQPLLERRLLEREAFEEVSAVQRGGALERGRRALGDLTLELGHVHVDGDRVQGDSFPGDQQCRGLRGDCLPEREKRLPEASARLRFSHATPEQGGKLLAGMRPARREREEGEERLSLPGRQCHGRFRAEPPLKATEESEAETRHAVLPRVCRP